MILPYTKIVGLPIFDFKNQQKVGQVSDLIFSPKDFKISGVILERSFFDRKAKVASSADIVDLSSQGVIVNDDGAILILDENVRLKEAIRSGHHGIGQKVVTKGGKSLGRVIDLFVSTEMLQVSKIHVKNILSERIISSTAVVEIKKRKIIVKDNFETVKMGVPVMGQSVI